MASIQLQGLNICYRDLIEGEEILYSNLKQEDQYFRCIEPPFSDDELVEIASESFDNRKSKYNKQQLAWVEKEEVRMTYGKSGGVYAMINGALTYIPASYWGYLNHWTLENGESPEYRESDRQFCLFFEYICFETDVLGITRGKSRRIGATSIGFYLMWWICGRSPEKRGGSISFNDDAAGRNFNTMFMRGFKGMLSCFVRDFDSAAEKFVRFVKPVEKAKKGVLRKREGLNSYCDYLSNSLNAYDSQRVSFLLADESGKYEKMDINTYWSKVSPTLRMGRKKVGFAYLPTTVNPKNKGGENFKQFWKEANQNEININTREPYGLNTKHKIVRYFAPATEGYAGCIDKFGNSVIEDPIEPIMGNDGEWIKEGSKTIILKERASKDGQQLREHRRDFPTDEFDMFAFESGVCEFNEERIRDRIEHIESHKEDFFIRRIRLYKVEEKFKNEFNQEETKVNIKWTDDPKGDWYLWEKPLKENNYRNSGGNIIPMSDLIYKVGVDTFKDEFAFSGSKGTICVFKNSCIVNGVETGLYPVLMYVGRPRLLVHLYEEVLKVCMWYGAKVNFELDAGTQYYNYFWERKAGTLLEWTPKAAIDPTRSERKIKPGTQSADPFQLQQQLEVCKTYVDGNNNEFYNGHVHRIVFVDLLQQLIDYNHSERTPYDSVIALMMALLPCMGTIQGGVKITQRRTPIFPTFNLKVPA